MSHAIMNLGLFINFLLIGSSLACLIKFDPTVDSISSLCNIETSHQLRLCQYNSLYGLCVVNVFTGLVTSKFSHCDGYPVTLIKVTEEYNKFSISVSKGVDGTTLILAITTTIGNYSYYEPSIYDYTINKNGEIIKNDNTFGMNNTGLMNVNGDVKLCQWINNLDVMHTTASTKLVHLEEICSIDSYTRLVDVVDNNQNEDVISVLKYRCMQSTTLSFDRTSSPIIYREFISDIKLSTIEENVDYQMILNENGINQDNKILLSSSSDDECIKAFTLSSKSKYEVHRIYNTTKCISGKVGQLWVNFNDFGNIVQTPITETFNIIKTTLVTDYLINLVGAITETTTITQAPATSPPTTIAPTMISPTTVIPITDSPITTSVPDSTEPPATTITTTTTTLIPATTQIPYTTTSNGVLYRLIDSPPLVNNCPSPYNTNSFTSGTWSRVSYSVVNVVTGYQRIYEITFPSPNLQITLLYSPSNYYGWKIENLGTTSCTIGITHSNILSIIPVGGVAYYPCSTFGSNADFITKDSCFVRITLYR